MRHNADHFALMVVRAGEWLPVIFDGLAHGPGFTHIADAAQVAWIALCKEISPCDPEKHLG